MISSTITPNAAKKLIAEKLKSLGIPYEKLTARTVSFSDLLRASALFVTVHGWKPNPAWTELSEIARRNNFFVEAD